MWHDISAAIKTLLLADSNVTDVFSSVRIGVNRPPSDADYPLIMVGRPSIESAEQRGANTPEDVLRCVVGVAVSDKIANVQTADDRSAVFAALDTKGDIVVKSILQSPVFEAGEFLAIDLIGGSPSDHERQVEEYIYLFRVIKNFNYGS